MTARLNAHDYGAYHDSLRDDYYGWATCAAAILAAGGGTMVIDGTPRLRTSINLQGVNIEALPGTRATADGGVTVTGSGVLFLAEPVATVFAGAGTWNLTGRQAVAGGVSSTVVAATTPAPETFGAAGAAGTVGTVSDSGHIHPLSAAAGGDLAGSTYPNPTIAVGAVTAAKIANNTITAGQLAPGAATGAALGADVVTTGVGVVRLAQQVIGSTVATISLTSIPATYKNLLLEFSGRSTAAAGGDQLLAQFNTDTLANYDTEYLQGSGTTAVAGNSVGATSMQIGSIAAGNAPSGDVGAAATRLPGYASTTARKTALSHSGYSGADSAGNQVAVLFFGHWRQTLAIPRILLFLAGGSFAAGTTVTLYGEP